MKMIRLSLNVSTNPTDAAIYEYLRESGNQSGEAKRIIAEYLKNRQ